MFQVVEYYQGQRNVLYTTDDEADAMKERDWQRDQWSCQVTARKAVVVERKR